MRASKEQIKEQTEELRETLREFAHAQIVAGVDMPVVKTNNEHLLKLLQVLRDGELQFRHCSMLTAVDLMPDEPRFEVVYGLCSVAKNRWVRVKTTCDEFQPQVPSATGLWPGVNWLEREVYDMFGIEFTGHPDLRRILMPETYQHFPLRKEFPRDGIRPDKHYRDWDAQRRKPEEELGAPETVEKES